MAVAATSVALEQSLSASGCVRLETSIRRSRRLQRYLIVIERRKLRGDAVGALEHLHSDPGVEELSLSAHLGHRNVGVPVRNGTVPGVRFERNVRESEDRGDQYRMVDAILIEAWIVEPRTPRGQHVLRFVVGVERRQRE